MKRFDIKARRPDYAKYLFSAASGERALRHHDDFTKLSAPHHCPPSASGHIVHTLALYERGAAGTHQAAKPQRIKRV
jgi:hypothetical protein